VHKGRVKGEVERHVNMNHLRILRREELRWQRRDVVTVGGGSFLIREWVIVKRLVPLRVSG
jgi:hypothetical protein